MNAHADPVALPGAIKIAAVAARFLRVSRVYEGPAVHRENDIVEDEAASASSITELSRRMQLLCPEPI